MFQVIPEYITRKLSDFTTAPSDRDRLRALYDLAAHSNILKRNRLREISDRYTFSPHEEKEILAWAKAKVE
jgi:hypothetical protein